MIEPTEKQSALKEVQLYAETIQDKAWLRLLKAEKERLKDVVLTSEDRDAVANQAIGINNLINDIERARKLKSKKG